MCKLYRGRRVQRKNSKVPSRGSNVPISEKYSSKEPYFSDVVEGQAKDGLVCTRKHRALLMCAWRKHRALLRCLLMCVWRKHRAHVGQSGMWICLFLDPMCCMVIHIRSTLYLRNVTWHMGSSNTQNIEKCYSVYCSVYYLIPCAIWIVERGAQCSAVYAEFALGIRCLCTHRHNMHT